ncbi:hypothetical protein PHMEG_00024675 [Phytophthora megakarya]|uniref:Uncharacterized protein n=1 Tax=Phytophthora megakarya TaxID=4795 RepID=A0A225VFK4_9STRA|nr:hypothetical protein PHMEG_00024675 [Phytophthora megakarya]
MEYAMPLVDYLLTDMERFLGSADDRACMKGLCICMRARTFRMAPDAIRAKKRANDLSTNDGQHLVGVRPT